MQLITMGTLVVLDHHEAADEEREENIEELKEGFISMKGDMGSFKKLRKKIVGK